MSNQLEPTQARIVALAKAERGTRTRREVFGSEAGMSFNTYANFESGQSWPRSVSLRRIEAILGWKAGAIDEAMASSMEPALIQAEHMRGTEPFAVISKSIQQFTESELAQELSRRIAERERYGLAASHELGGVGKDEVEP